MPPFAEPTMDSMNATIPPPARTNSKPLELEDSDLTQLFGCIEVKVVEDQKGNLREHVMIVLPNPIRLHRVSAASLEQQQQPEVDEELEYKILDDFAATLDSWLGCRDNSFVPNTRGLKSALRKKNPGSKVERSVSFDRLEIREFNMTLGNHPSATSGPPVMLDWDSQSQERIVDLDLYERAREPRRNRRELKLSFEDRRGILEKERGFSVAEVKEAWTEALKIRKQRQETREQGSTSMLLDEFWESAMRKYRRTFEYVGL